MQQRFIGMGKTKEYYRKLKKEAHDLFVHQGLSNKEISEQLRVSEKSVSKWINEKDGLWKTERHNAVINIKHQGDNLKEIIKMLADDKLEILKQIDEAAQQGDRERELELRKQAASLDNSVNAWGKQLAEMNKKNAITLSVYLEVMTRIFDALSVLYPDIYYKTLDFQEQHAYEVAKTLG